MGVQKREGPVVIGAENNGGGSRWGSSKDVDRIVLDRTLTFGTKPLVSAYALETHPMLDTLDRQWKTESRGVLEGRVGNRRDERSREQDAELVKALEDPSAKGRLWINVVGGGKNEQADAKSDAQVDARPCRKAFVRRAGEHSEKGSRR